MSFLDGRGPANPSFPGDAPRGAGPRLLLLCFVALCSSNAYARQNIPLTLAAAEDLALENEPGTRALLAQADALAEESIAAGQLPDPMLRAGLLNYPVESGGFTTEGMTQAQLGLRMEFPPGGERQASARRYESLAMAMQRSAAGRTLDVLSAVRNAWLEKYFWERSLEIVAESRPLFDDLVVVTRSLYSTGRRNQQDLLRAELELSRIDDRLLETDRQLAAAAASLSQWIGDDAFRPTAPNLPQWPELPAASAMHASLLAHPLVLAADARVAAREAGIDVAEAGFKPGWALDLGYAHRNGNLPDGQPRSDFVSLVVTMDLPFFREDRQDRRLAAALSERRAAKASREELLRRLGSRLAGEYARWADLTRRIQLYETRILPQTRDQARASLVAYQSDASDFADVMRSYIDDVDMRVELDRLRVQRAQTYAVLASLGGIPR